MKQIPFVLDRMCGTSFSKQLLEGLRDAIHIGYYPAGSVLPPRREISRWLGVSEIVVRSAFAQLAAEGLVVSRPRIGTVVLPQKSPVWRGHVLCVMTDHDFNFRLNSEVEILRSKLTREGFLFSQVQVLYGRSGKPDFTAFDHSIGRSVDFAVLAFGNDVIERRLSESGIPYAVLGGAWNGMKGCGERRGNAVRKFSREGYWRGRFFCLQAEGRLRVEMAARRCRFRQGGRVRMA